MDPQLTALARQSANTRLALYGVPGGICYTSKANGQSYSAIPAIMTGVSSKRQLEEGGFLYDHDSICRIRRCITGPDGLEVPLPFTPKLGDTVICPAGAAPLLVAEVKPHPINPEWLLGLTASI